METIIEDRAEEAIDLLVETKCIEESHIRALQDLLYNYRAFKICDEIEQRVKQNKEIEA